MRNNELFKIKKTIVVTTLEIVNQPFKSETHQEKRGANGEASSYVFSKSTPFSFFKFAIALDNTRTNQREFEVGGYRFQFAIEIAVFDELVPFYPLYNIL